MRIELFQEKKNKTKKNRFWKKKTPPKTTFSKIWEIDSMDYGKILTRVSWMTSESLSNFSREKKKNNCFFFFRKTGKKKTVLSENELVSRAPTFPGKKKYDTFVLSFREIKEPFWLQNENMLPSRILNKIL